MKEEITMQKVKERNPEFLVDRNGEPKAVVLDIRTYKDLLQIAEDKDDLREFEKLKHERAISFSKFEKELKKDGLL